MSFEDALIGNIDRKRASERLDKRSHVSAAYERAEEFFSEPDNVISESEFRDLYGNERVETDIRQVRNLEADFKRRDTPENVEMKKASDIFEAIMVEQAELSNWLGENVTMLRTSRYDDYVNKTDMIAEWHEGEREPNILGLAVDVTFSAKGIEEKLHALRTKVDRGELGTIKYYRNVDKTIRGERTGVPRVVVGAGGPALDELMRLWVAKDKKALAAHPIQRVITEQIYHQLKQVQSYAAGRGRNTVAQAYQRALSVVEPLTLEKSKIPLGSLEDDKVRNEILNQSRRLFRS